MQQLGDVLFLVYAGDADAFHLAAHLYIEPAADADGLGRIAISDTPSSSRVRVILAIEFGVIRNSAVERQRGHHGVFHSLAVDVRQHAGQARHTGQTCVLGGALAYSDEQRQYILLRV